VPARRKAFKNPSEEYTRIVDMMMKYALHNSGVSFNLKKHGENKSDVHTNTSNSLKVRFLSIHDHSNHYGHPHPTLCLELTGV
jgi:DNA mismatch repair protein MLH1